MQTETRILFSFHQLGIVGCVVPSDAPSGAYRSGALKSVMHPTKQLARTKPLAG